MSGTLQTVFILAIVCFFFADDNADRATSLFIAALASIFLTAYVAAPLFIPCVVVAALCCVAAFFLGLLAYLDGINKKGYVEDDE